MDKTTHMGTTGCEDSRYEELLNCFVDGVLTADEQVELYAHLATCSSCRERLDSIMMFRRISRQEFLHVPPAVDDAFFVKLAAHAVPDPADTETDRSVLSANVAMSLRTILVAASVVFIIGLFVPTNVASIDTKVVETRQERVNLAALTPGERILEAVYVFYPGLTITADEGGEEVEPALISIHN